MSKPRHLHAAPPAVPAGAVLLQPKRPASANRQFRITIEGVITPNGQIGIARLTAESEPGAPVLPLEAEAILRRVAFTPPAVPIQALGVAPPQEDAPTPAPSDEAAEGGEAQ